MATPSILQSLLTADLDDHSDYRQAKMEWRDRVEATPSPTKMLLRVVERMPSVAFADILTVGFQPNTIKPNAQARS
jgi:hypothetical protein